MIKLLGAYELVSTAAILASNGVETVKTHPKILIEGAKHSQFKY